MDKKNIAIKKACMINDVPQYELARLLGVSEGTFCRWLRTPLPDDVINDIIEMLNTNNTAKAKDIRERIMRTVLKVPENKRAGKYRFNGTEYANRALLSARNTFEDRNDFEKLFLET